MRGCILIEDTTALPATATATEQADDRPFETITQIIHEQISTDTASPSARSRKYSHFAVNYGSPLNLPRIHLMVNHTARNRLIEPVKFWLLVGT